MPLTAEERSEINRRNAAKSTGPRTDEGKAASRRNALRHGLRAEALALPNEDPEAVAARSDAWNDYYRPESPAARHLVNQCVAATLMAERCETYHQAALAKQVRDAETAWEAEREEGVAAAVALLTADAASAARRLARTGHGCRWMAARWEHLLAALDGRGWWDAPERDDAVRLRGLDLDGDRIQGCPEAWLTVLQAAACRGTSAEATVEWLFRPDRVPDLYRGVYAPDALPCPAESLRALRALAASQLAAALAAEADHRERADDADRDGAAARALVLHDGPSARVFLRYHAEARTSFQRAYGSLVKALERDADGAAPAVSPNEPNAPPPGPAPAEPPATPAEPAPPNEADSDAKPAGTRAPAGPLGVESDPEAPARGVEPRSPRSRKARPEREDVGTILLQLLAETEPAPYA